MNASKVIDSWAMVAWLLDLPAAAQVEAFIQEADTGNIQLVMSWINVGEVYYIAARRHGREKADQFLTRLPSLPIRLVLPEEDDIVAAALLKSAKRLAYADAFAVSLAYRERASIITGDPEIAELHDVFTMEWVGPPPEKVAP